MTTETISSHWWYSYVVTLLIIIILQLSRVFNAVERHILKKLKVNSSSIAWFSSMQLIITRISRIITIWQPIFLKNTLLIVLSGTLDSEHVSGFYNSHILLSPWTPLSRRLVLVEIFVCFSKKRIIHGSELNL